MRQNNSICLMFFGVQILLQYFHKSLPYPVLTRVLAPVKPSLEKSIHIQKPSVYQFPTSFGSHRILLNAELALSMGSSLLKTGWTANQLFSPISRNLRIASSMLA